MTKRFISHDDQKPGTGLPDVVETALNATYATKDEIATAVPAGVVTSETIGRIVLVREGDPLPPLAQGDIVVRHARPGATYFTDFADTAVGQIPAGWTDRWNTGAGWTVVEDATASAGKALKGTAANERLLSWDAINADPDRAEVEVLTRIKGLGTWVSHAVALRASGAAASKRGYRGGAQFNTHAGIYKYIANTAGAIGSTPYTLTVNVWHLIRFRAEGDQIKLKMWRDGQPEPAAWTIQATNAEITEAGWVGALVTSGNGDHVFDWFAVATGGRTAVKP